MNYNDFILSVGDQALGFSEFIEQLNSIEF